MIFVIAIVSAQMLILKFHIPSRTFSKVLFPRNPSISMQWRRRPNTAAASGTGLIVLLAAGSVCC